MKVGDLVYAKHPRMLGCWKPGMIVNKQPMHKVGYRYQVLFPDIGLSWIKFSDNLILFEHWIGD